MQENAPATDKKAPQNADIERFLISAGSLEMDFHFGLNELNKYLEDLRLLSLGVAFSELGIAQRRHESKPGLILPLDDAGTYRFVSRYNLNNPENPIPANSIALLKLSGVMRSESGISTPGISGMISDLREAYANDAIKGVIIETNSGGGESIAGTMLKSAIEERNKPVIGFGHVVASAAYRALSGADEIIGSSQSAEFGSIGTMISVDGSILNEYRQRYADFYGQGAPKKNAEHRAALMGDFSEIQKRVDDLTESFQNEIRNSRNLQGSAAKIAETLNGSMFDAVEAKKRGLVDMIGNMQTAVRRVYALEDKYKKMAKKGR